MVVAGNIVRRRLIRIRKEFDFGRIERLQLGERENEPDLDH